MICRESHNIMHKQHEESNIEVILKIIRSFNSIDRTDEVGSHYQTNISCLKLCEWKILIQTVTQCRIIRLGTVRMA